ncbi:MAG TPA: helix-turn-helix domain-containing protein [Jatrophihabitantaceae bacterium]|nr:helix-turn-helix domain-containing protein [Jatrophihabitantaceae bacterium]
MPAASRSNVALRADAARNRQTIIDSARRLYCLGGLDTPLDEIARTAGVGNATVYRHFPTRCLLVAAAFADTLRRVLDAVDRALANPDPWAGFAEHVRFLCRMQADDRGLADLLTTAIAGAPELEQLRRRAYRAFVRLAERARSAGALRADFTPEDIVLLLMANAGVVHRTADTAPNAWQRFIDLALDGLRAEAATPAAGSPCAAAVRRAMRQRGDEFGLG